MSEWWVSVGNIGTVYSGPSEWTARLKYDTYMKASRTGGGRGAHEGVVLFRDDEIVAEYNPPKREGDEA